MTTLRTALVLGGTAGIGLATAMRFSRDGFAVAIAGRDEARGRDALKTLRAIGGEQRFIQVDVQNTTHIDDLITQVVAQWGRLDVAFNNAGWEGVPGPIESLDEEDWNRMIDIKLNGVWRGVRAQVAQMRRQGHGAIVNMAGSWGLVGAANFASYCAAAHGIVGLTKAAALEVADAGIRINAVCPGAVDSPMLDRMVEGSATAKAQIAEQLAVRRICTPEEVAATVAWLCSDDASYINGAAIPMDGGGAS